MSKVLKSFDRIKNYQIVVNAEKDEAKTISELLPSSCNEVETALKDYEELKQFKIRSLTNDETKQLMKEHCVIIGPIEEVPIDAISKKLKALEIIKENLNIDEILLAVKGVCKASDYDLVKEVLL